MAIEQVIEVSRGSLATLLIISAPFLIAALLVGLLTAFLQTVTQIQDQALSFVPKWLATAVVGAITLPWLLQKMMEYSHTAFTSLTLMTGTH